MTARRSVASHAKVLPLSKGAHLMAGMRITFFAEPENQGLVRHEI